ncbi:tRNAPhe (7-(3-amino-3-carboxypropyl)wyosine37-C2)-hydroxylase [Aureococcus anophagefferens]|uniref:tRNAPhe (7-(3-amino-3-carboxypropyl)wyosine37-C2)-hydroxylase n=1 Tax=Aureococcus anophagefferens TaxID=44056 RepID=A0ABR1FY09_AURAN
MAASSQASSIDAKLAAALRADVASNPYVTTDPYHEVSSLALVAIDAYEAGDLETCLGLAERTCATCRALLHAVAAWDALTYWDAVPDGVQAAYAAGALLAGADPAAPAGASTRTPPWSARRPTAARRPIAWRAGGGSPRASRRRGRRRASGPARRRGRGTTASGARRGVAAAGRPARIAGAADGSPARYAWASPRALAGLGVGRVDATGDGRLTRVVPFGAVADAAERGGGDAPYLAQHRLLDQIPELRAYVADVLDLAPRRRVASVWVGPAGTVSAAHHDPADNLFVQFAGAKKWDLWAPSDDAPARPADETVALEPGAALFVPRGWWHEVTALDPAVSLSLWFDDDLPDGAELARFTADRSR